MAGQELARDIVQMQDKAQALEKEARFLKGEVRRTPRAADSLRRMRASEAVAARCGPSGPAPSLLSVIAAPVMADREQRLLKRGPEKLRLQHLQTRCRAPAPRTGSSDC